MSTPESTHINLMKYAVADTVTDEEACKLLIDNASKCPQIKKISPTPEDGIVTVNGKFYKYMILIKKGKAHVKAKYDQLLSMILAVILLPFALWFMWTINASGFDFKPMALPLALLLIVDGIVWTIGFTLGDKERSVILPFMYDTLTGTPAEHSPKKLMSAGVPISIILGLLGIVILAISFTLN